MAQEIPITPPGGEPPQGSKGRPDLKVVPEQTVAKPGATSDASNVIHLDTHPLAQQSNISSGEQHETTEEAVKHALDAERLAQLEASRAADLDAVITRAHTTNMPKHHGLPYRITHSRPFKLAAAAAVAVGLVGVLQEVPKFDTGTNSTPSGEVNVDGLGGLQDMSKVIIPTASQAPESVPLTELTETGGVLEVDKQTQTQLFVKNATVIKATYDPKDPNDIELQVKLPGDTLTKTVPSEGPWIDYTGLTLDVIVSKDTPIDYDATATTGSQVFFVPKPVFQVGQTITMDTQMTPYDSGPSLQTEGPDIVTHINGDLGKPNTTTSGKVYASLVFLNDALPS